MTNPDLVATEFAFESAIFFFDRNKLWDICDKGVTKDTILALTKRINGGTHGLADREEKTLKYHGWVKA
jgi:putative chitinase